MRAVKTRTLPIRLFAGFILFSLPVALPAADDEAGAWLIATFSDRLPSASGNGPWRYWLDLQARYLDAGGGVNQLLLRPGVDYVINERWSAWGGYARFRTRGASGGTVTENRLWQHLSWRAMNWADASLSMRFRLEQRDLSTGGDIGHSFRYQLKYTRRLVTGGRTDFIAYVEPFFDLRDTDYGADRGLSQNRIYAGLHWPLTEKSSLGVGCQNQRFFTDAAVDRSNHLAMLTFSSRF